MRSLSRCAAGLGLSLALAAGGCSDAPSSSAPALEFPRYDRVWQISTHNSYWVDRGSITNDLFASGTQERFVDQLVFDHARALEIDIHPDPARDGRFVVHHTVPGNSLCATLEDCLAELRAFHRAIPRHEVVNVSVELKGIIAATFDARHTPEDFDRSLRDGLGDLLLTPGEILADCAAHPERAGTPADESLGDCVARRGWPAIDALRGRFVVSLLGNWDDIGDAQCTRDWVTYAAGADIRSRAAFPMGSSWKLDWEALSPRLRALVAPEELARAVAQTPFLQVEDLADPRIDPFLARHGVVRVDGAFTADDQAARVARGMQLLQTDFPWVQVDDGGPPRPFRALDASVDPRATLEPGDRLLLDGPGDARVFAFVRRGAGASTRWEVTVASGRAPLRFGCLRAAAASGGGAIDSIEVCRAKQPASYGADPEGLVLRLRVCASRECADLPIDPDLRARATDAIALAVDGRGGEGSCATAYAATAVAADLTPTWEALGDAACFAAPLLVQGLARPADGEGGPVLFAGARVATGDREPLALRAADLDGIVASGELVAGDGTAAAERLTDLSVP